jgi:hypothetical protein
MKALVLSCSRIDPWLVVTFVIVVLILVLAAYAAGTVHGAQEIDP